MNQNVCMHCKTRLRSPSQSAAEAPDTRIKARQGLCRSCKNRIDAGLPPLSPQEPLRARGVYTREESKLREQLNRLALEKYLLRRRARGIPEQGLAA